MIITTSRVIIKQTSIFFGSVLILGLVAGLPVSAYAKSADQAMNMHVSDTGAVHVLVDVGPTFGGQMAHVYVDFLTFLVSLYLVLKLGGGKLRYPVLVMGLTSLTTAVISTFTGHQYMWMDGIIKSAGGMLAIIWLLGIFGLLGSSKTS